ncbi:Hypp5231 [Branchiostoma lanceolatum]|uniref:Hypp5231 protein n=1 Tax=Branchiostoma lanceolatum TaxID=7740 RepID=A0A8K0F3Q9_BRALA|nr:Hypp5231 [Branchiostoma lanceolatum]
MLQICEKLSEADARVRRLGLKRTETVYLRALLDAMANMDRSVEVEVLKSLGDVNLEKGKLSNDVVKFDMAVMLYRTTLTLCEGEEIRESLEYRKSFAEKLRIGIEPTTFVGNEPFPNNKEISSLTKVAEKFQRLDQRLTLDFNKDSLLIEYTTLMIEGIVNDDITLKVEAIKSLGDVYLKRGTGTRNRTLLTKATALYNTALARCEGVQGTVALTHRLLYTARIRQDMKRTGNKGLQHKQKTKQGYLSRDFPDTSAHADVTADVTSQQFVSPSDFIASQATRKASPDYRSYEEYLTTGERALAHGKLDSAEQKFVSALKLIHDRTVCDRPREAECLCRLGDVYVRRGKETNDGKQFTQAAALYNAAIARADLEKHKAKSNEALQEIEQSFLQYAANMSEKRKSSTIDCASYHKKLLENMRARAKSQLDDIVQQHNPYQYDENDPMVTKVEAERAEAVKALFKCIAKDRQMFVKRLVDECIATLGPPPCKYAFIGLGSQATELVTPYSDLEFAILIEDGKDNDVTRRYFLNIAHYLHLKVINLGETILPAMAIPSLNDFLSKDPEKDWFFDSITPRGFAFDGSMPWASKTPFGRDKTKSKPAVSLDHPNAC